jgi:hypothetical protein
VVRFSPDRTNLIILASFLVGFPFFLSNMDTWAYICI